MQLEVPRGFPGGVDQDRVRWMSTWLDGEAGLHKRVSGLEVSTPDVSQFTYLGPFTWALFQPQLKKTHPSHRFWLLCSPILACYPSAKSDCLKSSPMLALNSPNQEARYPPIKMSSGGFLLPVIGASQSLKFWSWENRLETALHWHTGIHFSAWFESFPSSLSEVKGHVVSKAR